MKHITIFKRDATPEEMVAQVDEMIAAAGSGSAANESAAPTYYESILPHIEAATAKAIAATTDPEQKKLIEDGHGTFVGTCGHVIAECRCSQVPDKILVDAPCKECAKTSE